MAESVIKKELQICRGTIPDNIATGETKQTIGGIDLYASNQYTISFPFTFRNVPTVFIQETGGNPGRLYQYRIIATNEASFTFVLVSNYPNYWSSGSKWVAIGL